MTSNIGEDVGLTDEVVQESTSTSPILASSTQSEDWKVREAIEVLKNADSDVIFRHYLALLPCLEKLGGDFLSFKRPGMLKDDSEHSKSMLDLVVESFRKEIYNLQRYLTPELALPLPATYRRPREEALAYAEKCNPFKKDTMGTSQEQQQIIQRLQAGLNVPILTPQTPRRPHSVGRARQRRAQQSHVDISPLTLPTSKSSKGRKRDISDLLQFDPRKRQRRNPESVTPNDELDPIAHIGRRTSGLTETPTKQATMDATITHLSPLSPYSRNLAPAQTPPGFENARYHGMLGYNPSSSDVATQGVRVPSMGHLPFMRYSDYHGEAHTIPDRVSAFQPTANIDLMISGPSEDNTDSSAAGQAPGGETSGSNPSAD